MASIELKIIGNTKNVYEEISKLENYAKNLKPIEMKFDIQGDAKLMNAFARANNAAANYQKELNKANAAEEKKRQSAKQTAEAINYLNTTAAKYDATIKESVASSRRWSAALQSQIKAEQDERRATEGLVSSYNVIDRAIHERENASKAFSQALRQQIREEQESAKSTKEVREEQDKTASSSNSLASSVHKIGDAYSKLWSRITSTVTRRLINQAFTALRSTIKDTLDVMKDVDTQLINIQKVSGKTSEEIAAIGERAYDTAAQYGVAVEDYLSAVYSFQKAGLGESAESLAELATKTMLVGDTTAAVAEKFLISSNAAWELHGNIDELNKVIDQADYINNNYATTLDKIAAGLPIVASVAANAGMTYSETMAALGTIQSITQESGTKSATALRALILNIEKEAGTYLTEEGEEFEVTAESIKGLQGLLEKYAATEMEAARASGELLNPMTAIKALFEGMQNQDVTDIELFQLLSAMGGKLRTNQLTALVKNFDMFDEMLQRIGNSAGTADNEVELMMQSWEKKSQVLKDRWQQFIAQLVSTDAIKGLIDDITEFVVNLDPAAIGAAIRDTLYPIIEFVKSVDWAGAAKSLSAVFDKIMAIAGGTAIAATLGGIIGGLDKVLGLLQSIGVLLGVGSYGAAVAGGAGIVGGLALLAGTFYNIAAPAMETQKQINRLTEASKELEAVTNDTDKTYQDQIETLNATRTVLGIYLDRLDGLTEGTDEYNKTLDAMVKLMPGLADIVDTTTGHIEGGRDAILEYADSWYKAAEAAVYQAQYTEIASEKVKAEMERTRNQNRLDTLTAEHPEIEAYKELLAARQAFEEKMFSGVALSAQESAAYNELVSQIDAMESTTGVKEAMMEANQLRAAIDLQTERIDAADAELKELTDLYGANNSAQENTVLTNEQDQAAAAAARVAEQRRGQKTATQEAAQAEQELAQASTESGSAGQEAATITATAVRQDTIPAVKELQEELNQIPAEKTITLVPHFDEAISKIKEYISFLEHIKGTYTSTLTSTVYHEAYNRDAQGNLLPGFYDGSVYGGSGVIGKAAGGIVSGGGKTLVNELGPELISENGRAYIAGGGKPTVVNLAPGAIVIPADETAEALKGGMPRMAAAYAFDAGGGGGNVTVTVHDFNKNPNLNGSKDPNYKPSTRSSSSSSGSGSGKGSGSSSGSSASVKVEVDFSALEKTLADELKRIDAEAKLAENEGDFKHVAEMYEAAQKEIKKLVDQYRAEGYADDSIEILTLLNKNYDYANKQLKLYQDKWDDLVKALEADTDATKALKELEEKRAALEESVAAYENAQKQRTVRIYNAETGQWEWIADQKKIDAAREKIDSAQESYNDAVKKQAIEELKKMGENISDLSDIVLGPALSAVVTMSEDSQEFQNFAAALNAVFGVGSFLQSTEGTTSALSTVDSHDTHYSFGGVDITPEQAGSMTLAQLAQMLQVLKIT